MASIAIDNLNASGLGLLSDPESFLTDVSDREMSATVGGVTPVITVTAAWGTVTVGGIGFGTGFAAGVFGAGAAGGAFVAFR